MDLLYDTRKLRILFDKDQKVNWRRDVVDTFKRDGYATVGEYTKRLIDMYSYEFQIEAAKALFANIPDNHNNHQLEWVQNQDTDIENCFFIGEPEMYIYNDIVVFVASRCVGDELEPERYIGYVSHIDNMPLKGLNRYVFTFKCVDHEKRKTDDVLMWTVGNLASYKRVVQSLSDEDAMSLIPKKFLKAPMVDINRDTTDTQEVFESSMNTAQRTAISRAIREDGDDDVVLVQGPPGCGKSTMIVEMVRLLFQRNTETQGLVCAQTNVAVVDLAYKYLDTNNPKDEFECLIEMKPPKMVDSNKRTILEPLTVISRYQRLVNAVLHTIIHRFKYQPIACHGNIIRDKINHIVSDDFKWCMTSGFIMLLPTENARILFMSMKTVIDDHSSDLTLTKRMIIGMRNEIAPFFKRDILNSLLEFCGQDTNTLLHSKPIPIYGWVRQALLNRASIVFCTINVGISVTFKKLMNNLVYIVIDEAAQALEADVAALMCVDSCFKRLILVGDPQQLRGYCASNRGKREMMDRSLMERLQTYRLCDTTFLNVQYRMHQNICDFVSRTFYKNKLTSNVSIHDRSPVTSLPPVMHVMFLGSHVSQSRVTATSVVNIDEARYIVAHIFNVLLLSKSQRPSLITPVTSATTFATMVKNSKPTTSQDAKPIKISIGIICIYKAQANVIRYLVDKMKYSKTSVLSGFDIVVNTIDSFQGLECDVIYVSLTRTTKINDFMDDANRVNVAMSRARHHLIVVGDAGLSLTDKQNSTSYWHRLCAGKNSMMIDPKHIKTVPLYDGPERVGVSKVVTIPTTITTIKTIIAKGLATTTPVWNIYYEKIAIDVKIPQGIQILEYVVQTLASGALNVGDGGRTTRPFFGKHREAALFFVTTVCGSVCLAWTVKVHTQCQIIELLGIGDRAFIETKIWSSFRRDIKTQPKWKLSASMNLCSSGTIIDLTKDMPKNSSLFYVPIEIDIPEDVLIDMPINDSILIDQDHIKAISHARTRPTMILGGGGTGKTECMLDMIEHQLNMNTDLDNIQLYLGVTDSLSNWSSMRLLKRNNITEQSFKRVSFTSLPSLLTKLYMPNDIIRGRHFVDRNVFRSEYMNAMPAMVRSIGADELYDSIHVYMDLERQGSIKPEYKTALKVYKSVKVSLNHIDAYDLHKLVTQNPQRLVAMASKITQIYIDEVQDISRTMWSIIEIMLSAGTSTMVCAGDFTQRLSVGMSIKSIKTLIYKHIPKSMEIVKFKTNHRSEANIVSLANRIQSFTHMREHAMEPCVDLQDHASSVTLIEMHNIEDKNVSNVLRFIGVPSNNYRAAIVTSSSWAHRLRKSLDKSHNVFSAYECKGLEFDLVVCWDLFHTSMDVKTSMLRRNMGATTLNEDNENFEIYLNHLYVTVTRARKHLIIVVPSCDRSNIMAKALGISDIVHYSDIQKPQPEIIIPFDELSVSDDLRMAIVMRERGLLQQALNVFEQYSDTAQAAFTRAQIHRKEHQIELCIDACNEAIEASCQSSDSLFKVEDVKLFLAQTLIIINQYAKACFLFIELEMEDDLIECLINAVESRSKDVIQLQSLVLSRSVAIWERIKTNERYAKFIAILMLMFESPSVNLVDSMLSHIPPKTALIMMHNVLAQGNRSVSLIWEIFQRRSSLPKSEILTFLEWSLLRRLDGQHANKDLVYIISSCYQSPMVCIFIGPKNNMNTKMLTPYISSGTMLEACQMLGVSMRHVAMKMRELSCPLSDFITLHSQIPDTDGESSVHLLAEAYKIHMEKMRGCEHQLTLFRWCAKMSGGENVIEMICTILKEDKQKLLAIYNPDNTVNATQNALLIVLGER